MKQYELDTPALLVDLNKMERNIEAMAKFARDVGVNLRPHVKTHKTPEIAHRQLGAGAKGICVQKLGEAETMAKAGINDIFITNQVVGNLKIRRLTALAQHCNVSVAVDSSENVQALSSAAREAGVEIGVFIEVDCGLHRCGVQPGRNVFRLAEYTSKLDGVSFRGVMAFEGHVYDAPSLEERRRVVDKAIRSVTSTVKMMERRGIAVEDVSVGTTPSVRLSAKYPGVTEVQPGNYVFNDVMQLEMGTAKAEDCALTVCTTIISRPSNDRAVIDAGSKAFAYDRGKFPKAKEVLGVKVMSFYEEHGVLKLRGSSQRLKIGDVVEFIPYHACTTVNLHDELVGVRDGKVETVWPILARGKMK